MAGGRFQKLTTDPSFSRRGDLRRDKKAESGMRPHISLTMLSR
jgi:hypothetical protein